MSTVSLLPADTSPVSVLSIRPWPDGVIDALGHDPRSLYVERFWLVMSRLASCHDVDASPKSR